MRGVWPCRAELQAYRKAKADEVLGLNNSVAVLKQRLEEAQAATREAEVARLQRREHASRQLLERGQVRLFKPPDTDDRGGRTARGYGLVPWSSQVVVWVNRPLLDPRT